MAVQRLPAEWEPQDAILLAWPHQHTNWDWLLDDASQLYEALVSVICDYADLVIAAPESDIEHIKARLEAMDVPLEYVYFYPAEFASSWVRDFGPVGVQTESGIKLLDFSDGAFTKGLMEQGAFPAATIEYLGFDCNPSAVEVDGQGALLVSAGSFGYDQLSTEAKAALAVELGTLFGVGKVNWLHHGYLMGADSGAHIKSLACFAPNNVLMYTACDDEQDEHYGQLKAMESELSTMTNLDGMPYRLLPLPWPGAKYDDNDQRIPASYANFLIVNEAILVPIYDSLSDEDALEVISQAFPGLEVFGIPSLSLIELGASLHRIAVPLPEGVLMPA